MEYDFEEEHIIEIPFGMGESIKAKRCINCSKIMFVNVGLVYSDYTCPKCRHENKRTDPEAQGLSQS